MIVTIAAITGFQVFWLRENYFKEKANLEFRSNVLFKETVRKLQAKKLNLDLVTDDSTANVRMKVMSSEDPDGFPRHPEQLTDVLNEVAITLNDSMRKTRVDFENRSNVIIRKSGHPQDSLMRIPGRGNVVISMNERFSRDSIDKAYWFERKGPPGEIFRFLYSVDSLQDSLRIQEIDSACRIAFKKEGLNVPIAIARTETKPQRERRLPDDLKMLNKITIGFAHPVTYEISIGNSFGYLL
ncbi:MAG TPA: hypothetical protein VJ765_16345, partial [Chitinophagaceae bacterium]|nr:hypothetical protein [Chitinophagaceae bacterium]